MLQPTAAEVPPDLSLRKRLLGALRPGWEALRAVWLPFLACQVLAVIVVLCYFTVPAFAAWCGGLARVRDASGVAFAMGGSVIAGVVLPEIVRRVVGDRSRIVWSEQWFRVAFFAVNGLLIDTFYRVQALIFGDSNAPMVVVIKVLVDQFIYTAFIAVPFAASVFAWQAGGFRLAPLLAEWRNGFVERRILPVLLPNWTFWFPMVFCIYALPGDLQYIFFLCVFAAWSLLFVRLVRRP